jgi:hypothetical protein
VTEYWLSSGAVAILIVIFGIAFLFVARRIMRIAIKLALVMTVEFAMLLTAGAGWWRGWFSSGSRSPARQANRALTRPVR